ncbi:hypothetical protein BS333_21175 (plasmid) [Vibrio azureus]|uniref:Uncharacterized protein n=1 Tax=Vibrio azureus NBRC 104587 TaxID=1219077 RepID=U3ADN7_9VIBR|nr:hypothetical protein [Vibrio azureus]AUI88889.1 hypothetical protein BS333_21175 [Vibrio azureus]GAD78036.1 hypothetical protein VAZ01S_114_00010 [Vibrio azureus NBRC 104587]
MLRKNKIINFTINSATNLDKEILANCSVDEGANNICIKLNDMLNILRAKLINPSDLSDADVMLNYVGGILKPKIIMEKLDTKTSPNESQIQRKLSLSFISGVNQPSEIKTNWAELVWSALMMGKSTLANLAAPYKIYDLKMRAFMLRALLSDNNLQIVRSQAYQDMEASEKANASFWLGMFMTKLIAARKLNCYFVTHAQNLKSDEHLKKLFYTTSKKLPDLFGFVPYQKTLLVFEAKGTSNQRSSKTINKAKSQLEESIHLNSNINRYITYSYFKKSGEKSLLQIENIEVDSSCYTIDNKSLKQLLENYYQPLKGLDAISISNLEQMGIYLRFTNTLKGYLEGQSDVLAFLNELKQVDSENEVPLFIDRKDLVSQGYQLFGDGVAIRLDPNFWPTH